MSSGKNLYQYFFNEIILPDTKHAALLFAFLVSILQSTEKEHEQLLVLETLKEGVEYMPEAFGVIEGVLFPFLLDTVLKRSENPQLLSCCNYIIERFYAFKQNHPTTKLVAKDYLQEIGFQKVIDCTAFVFPDLKMGRALTVQLIEAVLHL
eukprot:TRINITY_DN7749_c0_g1_i1.p1 TRINITY_DN7749_c0_g1~~TRINITY_DN7749_c0_g1_i1.p1  ORF type:complete len:168 (-),score=43.51 TRINITY_DN7749_c0_g1_i1:9-461(-)